jgi:DNA-binding response OmpR family regulator
VRAFGSTILLCDEEREPTDALAAELVQLGHRVALARSCAEAFAYACAHDVDALVVAPFLVDGAALVLPRALGIRRPRLVVLVTRLTERLAAATARRIGFDAQLTKVVDARQLDRLVRSSLADEQSARRDDAAPPASEVGGRGPR